MILFGCSQKDSTYHKVIGTWHVVDVQTDNSSHDKNTLKRGWQWSFTDSTFSSSVSCSHPFSGNWNIKADSFKLVVFGHLSENPELNFKIQNLTENELFLVPIDTNNIFDLLHLKKVPKEHYKPFDSLSHPAVKIYNSYSFGDTLNFMMHIDYFDNDINAVGVPTQLWTYDQSKDLEIKAIIIDKNYMVGECEDDPYFEIIVLNKLPKEALILMEEVNICDTISINLRYIKTENNFSVSP